MSKKGIMAGKGGGSVLNQVILVGRVVRNPELHDVGEDNKVTFLTVAVPRSFKNINGEYDTDFISCTIWKGIAENVCEYCHKGDLIGIKGHLQTREIKEEETSKTIMEVIVEKVTFLSSKKEAA